MKEFNVGDRVWFFSGLKKGTKIRGTIIKKYNRMVFDVETDVEFNFAKQASVFWFELHRLVKKKKKGDMKSKKVAAGHLSNVNLEKEDLEKGVWVSVSFDGELIIYVSKKKPEKCCEDDVIYKLVPTR